MGIDEFTDQGWAFAAAEARRVVGEGPTYLTFDIDSLDPAEAPGTGTPEAGGITAREALRLLRAMVHEDAPAMHGANLKTQEGGAYAAGQ